MSATSRDRFAVSTLAVARYKQARLTWGPNEAIAEALSDFAGVQLVWAEGAIEQYVAEHGAEIPKEA